MNEISFPGPRSSAGDRGVRVQYSAGLKKEESVDAMNERQEQQPCAKATRARYVGKL